MATSESMASNAAYTKLVAKAWSDPVFKAKLLANPVAALTAVGVMVPAGVTIEVLEDTGKLVHFVLPARPAAGELSDADLEKIAAAGAPNEFKIENTTDRTGIHVRIRS